MDRENYEKPELGKVVLAYDEAVLTVCKNPEGTGPQANCTLEATRCNLEGS